PKDLAKKISCSSVGYNLNLYAFSRSIKFTYSLFVIVSLSLDIILNHINWGTASRQQTKTFRPKHFFPKKLFNSWKVTFYQTRTSAFIGVDEFCQFGFWLSFEHNVNMVFIMIPLHYSNVMRF